MITVANLAGFIMAHSVAELGSGWQVFGLRLNPNSQCSQFFVNCELSDTQLRVSVIKHMEKICYLGAIDVAMVIERALNVIVHLSSNRTQSNDLRYDSSVRHFRKSDSRVLVMSMLNSFHIESVAILSQAVKLLPVPPEVSNKLIRSFITNVDDPSNRLNHLYFRCCSCVRIESARIFVLASALPTRNRSRSKYGDHRTNSLRPARCFLRPKRGEANHKHRSHKAQENYRSEESDDKYLAKAVHFSKSCEMEILA